jgi:hypothetical protein
MIAVIFYLMKPIRGMRDGGGASGEAKFESAGDAGKIGKCPTIANPMSRFATTRSYTATTGTWPRWGGESSGAVRASHNADQSGGSIMRSASSELPFRQLLILGFLIGEQVQKPFVPDHIVHDGGFGEQPSIVRQVLFVDVTLHGDL